MSIESAHLGPFWLFLNIFYEHYVEDFVMWKNMEDKIKLEGPLHFILN